MAEQQDSLTDEQLDERVDALVREMTEVSDQIARAVSDEPVAFGTRNAAAQPIDDETSPRDETPTDDPQPESLDDQVEAMLTDALADEAEPFDIPAAEESDTLADPEPSGEQAAPTGDRDPEAMQTPDPAPEPPADPAPEPVAATPVDDAAPQSVPQHESPETVEDLDAELAELAGELLDGDFDDVDAVLEAGNPTDPYLHDETDLPDAEDGDAQSPEAEHAEDPADEAETEPADAATASIDEQEADAAEPPDDHAQEAAEPSTTASGASDETSDSATQAPGDAPRGDANEVPAEAMAAASEAEASPTGMMHRLTSAVYGAALSASKPLDARPGYIRDVVGWIAAVTLFNAVAVWAFWLLVRPPAETAPSADVVTISTSDSPVDAAPGG